MIIGSFEQRLGSLNDSQSLSLQDFHRKHKLTLMAHGQEPARELGRIVAEGDEEVRDRYQRKFDELIESGPPPRSKHTNVLQHMFGHLKDQLPEEEKQSLLEQIHQYRNGQLDLVEVVSVFRQKFETYPDQWIEEQTYWQDVGHRAPDGGS